MTEEKIQELLNSLFSLKYNWNSGSSYYTNEVINKEGRVNVEQVIRAFLLENRDSQLGEMQAKIFAYEQIISKSNFAPMLIQNQEDDTTRN